MLDDTSKNYVCDEIYKEDENKPTPQTMGSKCTERYCSCTSFVTGKGEAQWCENCGHARSMHTG